MKRIGIPLNSEEYGKLSRMADGVGLSISEFCEIMVKQAAFGLLHPDVAAFHSEHGSGVTQNSGTRRALVH